MRDQVLTQTTRRERHGKASILCKPRIAINSGGLFSFSGEKRGMGEGRNGGGGSTIA